MRAKNKIIISIFVLLVFFSILVSIVYQNDLRHNPKASQTNSTSDMINNLTYESTEKPWKVYPKPVMKVNNKSITDTSKLSFKKGEKITFSVEGSFDDIKKYNFYKSILGSENAVIKAEIKDTNINIKKYYWDFGDYTSLSSKTAFHSYNEDGTYIVSLISEHINGNLNSVSVLIKIGTSKESNKIKTFDREELSKLSPQPDTFKEQSVASNTSVLASSLKSGEKDKIALLIDSLVYQTLSQVPYLIEGRNPIDLYIQDVEYLFPEVDIILINDKNWEDMDPINCSPQPTCRPEYDIRQTLKNLYDGSGIKGAVLVGNLPYFKWYQQLFGDRTVNKKTVCGQCYMDLDGLYEDRYAFNYYGEEIPCSGSTCDGYLDYVNYQPTGHENKGTEIWTSWIRPLIGIDRPELVQMKDFFLKNHQYYQGINRNNDKIFFTFNNAGQRVIDSARDGFSIDVKNHNYVQLGFGQGSYVSLQSWISEEVNRYKYGYTEQHGNPSIIAFGEGEHIDGSGLLNLSGRSLIFDTNGCSTANFNLALSNNVQLSTINGNNFGLISHGNFVVHNWFMDQREYIPIWTSTNTYYAKAWFEGNKYYVANPKKWAGDNDPSRNLFSMSIFGNPFIKYHQTNFLPIPTPTPCPQEEVVQDTNPQSINTYCSATVGSQCVSPNSWSTSLTCHHAQGSWAPFGPNCTNPYCEGCKCTKCMITNMRCSIGTQNKWVALRWDLENYNSNYKVVVSKSGEIVSESKYGEPLKMVYNPEECQNYIITCKHKDGVTSDVNISKGCGYTPGESCQ